MDQISIFDFPEWLPEEDFQTMTSKRAAEKPKDTVPVGIKCICCVGYCPECGGFQDDLAEECRYCGCLLDWSEWKRLEGMEDK